MNSIRKKISLAYLWLIPVLSVPVLYLVKNNTALWVFITAVSLHLLLVLVTVLSLSKQHDKLHKSCATLLILGATCTFISATTFPTIELKAISANKFGHYWTSIGFLISQLIFWTGMNSLNAVLEQQGLRSYRLGFLAISIGSLLWFGHLYIRLTAMVWAADQNNRTGIIPESYAASELWGGAFYVGYMVLTYAGFIAYGRAFQQSSSFPGWLSKFTLIFGIITPIMFAVGVGPFRMPIAIQIVPWLIGIFLIQSGSERFINKV